MTPDTPDLFGRPLKPDPRVALPSLPSSPLVDGPAPRVQFTVELVGQYPTPAASVGPLLSQPWFTNLGQPEVFILRPMENDWVRLVPTNAGSYDSVLLAWNYLGEQGQLSTVSAGHLLYAAERFALGINRRAVSLTDIDQVDEIASSLRQVEQQLDVGMSLGVVGASQVLERDLWIVCSDLGLSFSSSGSFDWTVPGHPHPVLSVTPIGLTEAFSLANVQQGMAHDGVTVGFRLATCPAATIAADGAFRVAQTIAQAIRGMVFDDEQQAMTPKLQIEMKRDLDTAIAMLSRAGLSPGSPAALKIFR